MSTVLSELYGNLNLNPQYCLILLPRTRILLKRFHYTLTLVVCCFITALVFPCATVNNQVGLLCKDTFALKYIQDETLKTPFVRAKFIVQRFTMCALIFNLLSTVLLWKLLVLSFSLPSLSLCIKRSLYFRLKSFSVHMPSVGVLEELIDQDHNLPSMSYWITSVKLEKALQIMFFRCKRFV